MSETIAHRTAVIRWRPISGDRRIRYGELAETTVFRERVAKTVRSLRQNGASEIKVIRIWMVCSRSDTYSGRVELQRWDHLVMAQAHRDGRNFHYAKWLMTRGQV